MKRILTVLLFLTSLIYGQGTILGPGDIVIVGFNFDNPDEFAFVLLKDISTATEIKFTDNGWKADNTFYPNEGVITWTAPLGGLTSGQVISISNNGGWTATFGSVASSGSFFLSTSGDQILAYQGTDIAPVFIYGVNSQSSEWQADAANSNDSALPLGLINGNTCVAIDEIDNSVYIGSTNLEPAELLIAVGNLTNWSGSNSSRQTMPNGQWALPVELTTFAASVSEQSVELNWETATEVNNYGFEIERQYQVSSNEKQEWTKVGFINGYGNSNSTKYYSYSDNAIAASGKYLYRLKQIDFDGAFEYSDVIEANLGSPVDFELTQNYPNPFNPVTNIQFNLPNDSRVKLSVFNVLGEEVAQLVNGNIAAGFHSVKFDGANFNSGIYFYKLESENFVQIRKMMLVK